MKKTRGEKTFNIFNILLISLLTITMLVPLMYVVTTSLMPDFIVSKYNNTLIFPLPKYITFSSYAYIFLKDSLFLGSFVNSVLVVIVGTFSSMLLTSLMAYPLSKKYLKGRTGVLMFVFITMILGGGMIPTFLVVYATGLVDSLWALIIPSLISPWNMLILRNFYSTVPSSLEESAYIDGASDFQIFIKIYLPLSKPAMATISLFYAVGYWNDFISAVLYLNTSSKWTLQLFLRQILVDATPSLLNSGSISARTLLTSPPPIQQVKMAAIVASTIPILLVYPFVQKYFVKGALVGSVKG